MEADLQEHYHLALADLLVGPSWRRLGVLLRGLPPTSRMFQALHGERWERTDMLLAAVHDRLAVANWQRSNNKRQARPQPIPRPGVEKGKRYGNKSMTIDEWRSRHAEGGGQDRSRTRHGLHQPRPVS